MLKSSHPATQSPSVKQAIALSLGLGDMQAIDPLIQLLADADAGVKLHVITALKQLAPAAHSQLQQLANQRSTGTGFETRSCDRTCRMGRPGLS